MRNCCHLELINFRKAGSVGGGMVGSTTGFKLLPLFRILNAVVQTVRGGMGVRERDGGIHCRGQTLAALKDS